MYVSLWSEPPSLYMKSREADWQKSCEDCRVALTKLNKPRCSLLCFLWQLTVVQATDLHVNVCTQEQYEKNCCIVCTCIATCSCCSSAVKYSALCVCVSCCMLSTLCWQVIPTHWELLYVFPHSRHAHYIFSHDGQLTISKIGWFASAKFHTVLCPVPNPRGVPQLIFCFLRNKQRMNHQPHFWASGLNLLSVFHASWVSSEREEDLDSQDSHPTDCTQL